MIKINLILNNMRDSKLRKKLQLFYLLINENNLVFGFKFTLLICIPQDAFN